MLRKHPGSTVPTLSLRRQGERNRKFNEVKRLWSVRLLPRGSSQAPPKGASGAISVVP